MSLIGSVVLLYMVILPSRESIESIYLYSTLEKNQYQVRVDYHYLESNTYPEKIIIADGLSLDCAFQVLVTCHRIWKEEFVDDVSLSSELYEIIKIGDCQPKDKTDSTEEDVSEAGDHLNKDDEHEFVESKPGLEFNLDFGVEEVLWKIQDQI